MRNHWLDDWETQQEKFEAEFNERAAIMEYDAGMSKSDAETKALKLLKVKYPVLIQLELDLNGILDNAKIKS